MNGRYLRQELFSPIGKSGQKKLREKHVVIVGCGALGSAIAENLTRAGIGKLTLLDRDYVEWSNLQRQQLFTEYDASHVLPKVVAAKDRLGKINSEITINAKILDVNGDNLLPIVKNTDLVLDATDNFSVRLVMNDVIHHTKVPMIFGACAGSTGSSFTIVPHETPCLVCLLNNGPVSGGTCDSTGIIMPAVQMVAAIQTAEALKILVEDFNAVRTTFIVFDLWNNLFQQVGVRRAESEACPTCGNSPTYPYLKETGLTINLLCGRNTVLVRSTNDIPFRVLCSRLRRMSGYKANPYLVSVEYKGCRIVIFRDGRALIHGTDSIETAGKLYDQLIG